MAEPVQVYRCDKCNRVVAEVRDGKLVLIHRHDTQEHETVILTASLKPDTK